MEQQGEIILYQPDESVRMEVRIEDETVWLTQAQIVELFQSSKANISEHLKNIYKSEELIQISTVRNFRTVRQEGNRQITRNLEYYNLDVIISVGYRVNTKRGIQFRQWANSQAHTVLRNIRRSSSIPLLIPSASPQKGAVANPVRIARRNIPAASARNPGDSPQALSKTKPTSAVRHRHGPPQKIKGLCRNENFRHNL